MVNNTSNIKIYWIPIGYFIYPLSRNVSSDLRTCKVSKCEVFLVHTLLNLDEIQRFEN